MKIFEEKKSFLSFPLEIPQNPNMKDDQEHAFQLAKSLQKQSFAFHSLFLADEDDFSFSSSH